VIEVRAGRLCNGEGGERIVVGLASQVSMAADAGGETQQEERDSKVERCVSQARRLAEGDERARHVLSEGP
jgi:hypothetical protein